MATNFPTSLDSASGGNPFGFAAAKNFLSTTLNGGINAAVTTITVVSTTNFPTRGLISIDTEVISYTGTTATTFTGCTRGADSTTAATHLTAATVAQVPTALNHNDVTGAIVATETKVGTGSSTATANTVLRGTGVGTTAYGQIVNGDITTNTIVAPSKVADGGANTVLGSNGTTPTWRQIANGDIATNTIVAPSKIADGGASTILGSNGTTPTWRQVATGDIATAALTQRGFATTFGQTTTSGVQADVASSGFSLTVTSTTSIILMLLIFAYSNTNAAINTICLGMDSGTQINVNDQSTASAQQTVTLVYSLTGVSAAAHTFQARWSTSAGTLSNFGSYLSVIELKK